MATSIQVLVLAVEASQGVRSIRLLKLTRVRTHLTKATFEGDVPPAQGCPARASSWEQLLSEFSSLGETRARAV